MTIRFAAARKGPRAFGRAPVCRSVARTMVCRAMEHVANDDIPPRRVNETGGLHDEVLRAALRHFAQHGLGAARIARAQADAAHRAGDRQSWDWWMGITRTLDRRLATDAR